MPSSATRSLDTEAARKVTGVHQQPVDSPEEADDERRRGAVASPLTAERLARLGRLVPRAHEQYEVRRPDLAGTLVAGVLAQGATAHHLHPDAGVGVQDLDVRLFHAQRDGR